MDILISLGHGMLVALEPINLLYVLVGVFLGTAVGILPGIGPSLTIALLLPITAGVNPSAVFMMFAGIYYGAQYGGSTTTILINTPGEATSVVTALEGYQMARRGRAGAALATAAIGSFVAGNIAAVAMMFFSPILVKFALRFGPAEYFALMVLAVTTITGLLGAQVLKGLASLFIGLALGLVGMDLQTGQARFTFGFSELLDGIDVVIIAVGLFGVGEMLWMASRSSEELEEKAVLDGPVGMTREEWSRSWLPWLRGSGLGFAIGSLPAGGGEIPTFLSYAIERKLSRRPKEWGKGAIEGVAGPEAANNAAAGGSLMPLLTLGIPTSATAAIMLAAFNQYGLQPGPLLFVNSADLVWGLIASLYIGNVMLLVLNLPMIPLWVRVLDVPKPQLYAAILIFATLGAWSLNGSYFDLGIIFLVGCLSFAFRCFSIPLGPLILGFILGPRLEQEFRRALAVSAGDYLTFFERPISLTIFIVAALMFAAPFVYQLWNTRRIRAALLS